MLEQQILERLTVLQGNVPAVAQELQVSPSYVYRVKNNLWQAPVTALVPAQIPQDDNSPAEDIKQLRDEIVSSLQADVQAGNVSANVRARILQVLLSHEISLKSLNRPVLPSIQQFNINTLVDKVGQLDAATLRQLAGGIPLASDIVEGEVRGLD